jgi:uncharacterized protein YqeY
MIADELRFQADVLVIGRRRNFPGASPGRHGANHKTRRKRTHHYNGRSGDGDTDFGRIAWKFFDRHDEPSAGASMSISEQVQKDMVGAMKARDERRLSTLRMVKSALKNKEIDKRAPLDDREALQVLSTLIKQRKDSVEQFTKGGRQDLADKEAAEIVLIETYMPKAVGEDEIAATVRAAIAEMGSPTMKDMGAVMKNVMAKFAGARVDGKVVSDAVKKELAGK